MNKNLPKVFANPINKDLKNNKEVSFSTLNEDRNNSPKENIPHKINEIFANPHHVYKSKVRITTKDNTYDTTIVGKTGFYLLALNGDKFNLNDIIDIERI